MPFENRYSVIDRALHHAAFNTSGLQVSLSDIEDHIFARQFEYIQIEKPVFVTAIPRAGTTLLLELLVRQGGFASHCYRDMPFVLMPLLWNRLSRPFIKAEAPRERAHGDGMLVSVDSPEAFEEIAWKAYWKTHYREKYITPWESEENAEFKGFLRNHLKKIIALRTMQSDAQVRYISKNNLNIARIDFLLRIFPDARIVLPFREPVQHASSLLKQHINFIGIHRKDPFARKYMEAIGHYDFGENLRPVDFDDWCSRAVSPASADTLEFWLRYWVMSYRYLLRKASDQVVLFHYDAFCDQPRKGLQLLGEYLDLADKGNLADQASRVKAARPHAADTGPVAESLVREAGDLFAALQERSIL